MTRLRAVFSLLLLFASGPLLAASASHVAEAKRFVEARLLDLNDDEEMTFTLVFPEHASIDHNRISVVAPIGTAMLGQR